MYILLLSLLCFVSTSFISAKKFEKEWDDEIPHQERYQAGRNSPRLMERHHNRYHPYEALHARLQVNHHNVAAEEINRVRATRRLSFAQAAANAQEAQVRRQRSVRPVADIPVRPQ